MEDVEDLMSMMGTSLDGGYYDDLMHQVNDCVKVLLDIQGKLINDIHFPLKVD